MNKISLTMPEIRKLGLKALRKELGVQGFVQFMQDFGLSYGDYTKDRNIWLTEKTVDEVANQILKKKKSDHLE